MSDDKMREGFEEYMRVQWPHETPVWSAENGEYENNSHQHQWEAFQAGSAFTQQSESELDPVREENPGRCGDCGRAHILDTSLPSDIWNQIADPVDMLCAVCIDKRLTEKGLQAEAEFYFVGKSLVSKLYSEAPAPAESKPVGHWDKKLGMRWREGLTRSSFENGQAFYTSPPPWIELAACLYQACGAYDMPERILDVLSLAQRGEPFGHLIDGLLPCAPQPESEPAGTLCSVVDAANVVVSGNGLGSLKSGTEFYLIPQPTPQLPDGFTHLAYNRETGEWMYINHAGDWHLCPCPVDVSPQVPTAWRDLAKIAQKFRTSQDVEAFPKTAAAHIQGMANLILSAPPHGGDDAG